MRVRQRGECDHCHRVSRRLNTTRNWTSQAPGKLAGWVAEKIHICTYCQNEHDSRRIMILAGNRVVDIKASLKRRLLAKSKAYEAALARRREARKAASR